MPHRIAYVPLNTYPEAVPDAAVLSTISFAGSIGCGLHIVTFAVDVPHMNSPLGGFFINVEGMARAAEDRSKAECDRLRVLIRNALPADNEALISTERLVLGAALDAAAGEARYQDLALLPWSATTASAQDMAQALVFGAGVPVILVPAQPPVGPVDHVVIAWDGSRVAARALSDVLPLVSATGRVSVVTVEGEKSLAGAGLADTLSAALVRRGYNAKAVSVSLAGRSISVALQETALAEGAQLLAMGGFGHSRLRDFILGGATKGVFSDLRLPVLLSH